MRADKANLQKRFDAVFVEEENYRLKFVQNAFEFPKWPVISSVNRDEIRLMNWGLIPSWIKDEATAFKFRVNTVNARSETIFEKPAFRKAAANQRCLVLADGFFEFREVNGKKFPYYIRIRDGRPFAMAGLYENWTNPSTGEVLPGFSIITTEANSLMKVIHNRKNRMPVILNQSEEREWLTAGGDASDLLKPFSAEEMEAWPVAQGIGRKGGVAGSEEIFKPFDYPELSNQKPVQGSLFG